LKLPARQLPGLGLNRIGVAVLSAVALAAMLSAWILFTRLLDAERDMDAIVREDAMWAVYQTDRHLRELEHLATLIAETGDTRFHEPFIVVYDILYSRVVLLERGTFLLDLGGDSGLSRRAADLSAFVVGLAPQIDSLDPAAAGFRAQIDAIAASLRDQRAASNALVLGANADMSAFRVAERETRRGIQDQLAALALVLILAFIGIFLLLLTQLRRIARSNRHMALLQERSRRQTLRAQAATKAKSAFLATMSHEIRTPLNGIIGSVELLSLGPLPADQRARIDTMRATAFLLRDLIDGVLDFSKLEAGAIDTRVSTVDLGDLNDLMAKAFAAQAQESGLALSLDLPRVRILASDTLLRRVLLNLIGNALKFTPHGRVRVRGALTGDHLLRVEVEDEGIGIPLADQPRLFKEFSQLDGSFSRKYGGTGLGLAICKRIVVAMGGVIGVVSEPGRGSLFWFEIPVERAPDAIDTGGAPGQADSAAPRRALQVLVVEDNDVNRQVLDGLLTHLGHRPAHAGDGLEAVAYLAHTQPDLVLMDMQMPGMDGPTATREIRAMGHRMPIVAVSANAYSEDRNACFAAGMDAFLPKPVTHAALVALLDQFAVGPPGAPADPPRAPDSAPPQVISADPGPAALDAQLQDLLQALGKTTVLGLIDRFEGDVRGLSATLLAAVDAADPAAQDHLLHTFKGAALTLGLALAGQKAQELRAELPLGPASIDGLVQQAHLDLARCRAALALAA